MFLFRRGGDNVEERVGRITHYFTRLGVGVVELTDGDLKIGDTIHIKGHTTDFEQKVESMQIEHKPIEHATKGQSIGLKVKEHVREHDIVYKVIPE
jgi:putative protease